MYNPLMVFTLNDLMDKSRDGHLPAASAATLHKTGKPWRSRDKGLPFSESVWVGVFCLLRSHLSGGAAGSMSLIIYFLSCRVAFQLGSNNGSVLMHYG